MQLVHSSGHGLYHSDASSQHLGYASYAPHRTMDASFAQLQQYRPHAQEDDYTNPLGLSGLTSRPSSSSSQVQLQTKALYNQVNLSNTPMISPQPSLQKPAPLLQDNVSPLLVLDTECGSADGYLFPSTPALSASGSAVNSPPSTCGVLPTPVSGNVFFGLEALEGVKEGCESEVQSENLAGGDWAWMGSPPMTPVFIHPPSVTASQASDLLSANTCPSLSPSPSPLPRSSVSDTELDFCDPRELTVGSSSDIVRQLSPIDFPALPTLCTGDDEEHKHLLGANAFTLKSASEKAPVHLTRAITPQDLPAFDDFCDLDSEDDFVNGLVDFTPSHNVHFLGSKRQRTQPTHFENDIFSSEEDLEEVQSKATPIVPCPTESIPTPDTVSLGQNTMKIKKKAPARRPKKIVPESESSDSDIAIKAARSSSATSSTTAPEDGGSTNSTSEAQQSPSSGKSQNESSESNTASSNSDGGVPAPVPVNRRGRKQSLTDDPSKTFACDLCSRRFRRQEHLKRHYRSLHTQEKPFECNECGKKFSRSDNLSQHARTHGAGNLIMGVLEEGELPSDEGQESMGESEVNALGNILYEAAKAAMGSSSDSSAESSSLRDSVSPAPSDDDQKPSMKRKREEDSDGSS
ncbi:MAG: hypothetical protein M1817_003592 [Caeruleum heppii]|nr:MAG: hypothetical protein M1817_003592 [Caeruleum heppii]